MSDADAAMRASRMVSGGAADMLVTKKKKTYRQLDGDSHMISSADVRAKGKNLKPKEWGKERLPKAGCGGIPWDLLLLT